MATTFERVQDTIIEQIGMDSSRVIPDANLFDDLGFDSLDCVEMIMTLENDFDVEIADEKAEEVQTVEDVVNLLDRLAD